MTLEVAVAATFGAEGATPFEVEVDLTVAPGETLVVLGPSGSGKTLLLETVAGYHEHEGAVRVDGRDVTGEPPEARDFGFVFQSYALFPHMTVRENVAFGTRYHPDGRDPDALLAELGIADLAERTPPTLSGGEAQRVALARSLAIRPSTLLLDEPLSALDVPTRETLRAELASVIEDVTALYVTHNRTTARELGDRIAVMRDGRVVQVGTPGDVFDRPATPFVARFTGSNCVPATVWAAAVDGASSATAGSPGSSDVVRSGGGDRSSGGDRTRDGDRTSDGNRSGRAPSDGGAQLAIRPEHVVLGEGGATATVERATRADNGVKVALGREGSVVEAYARSPPEVGAETTVGFPGEHVVRLADGEG